LALFKKNAKFISRIYTYIGIAFVMEQTMEVQFKKNQSKMGNQSIT